MDVGPLVEKSLQVGKIQHAGVEPAQQGPGVVHIEVNIRVWILPEIAFHHRWQNILANGLGGPDSQGLSSCRRGHLPLRLADHPPDPTDLPAQLLPLLRQAQALVPVEKEAGSVLALQVLDMLGDRGLGQVQIFCGPGVVEGLAQIQKRIIAEIQHDGPPSPAYFRP